MLGCYFSLLSKAVLPDAKGSRALLDSTKQSQGRGAMCAVPGFPAPLASRILSAARIESRAGVICRAAQTPEPP